MKIDARPIAGILVLMLVAPFVAAHGSHIVTNKSATVSETEGYDLGPGDFIVFCEENADLILVGDGLGGENRGGACFSRPNPVPIAAAAEASTPNLLSITNHAVPSAVISVSDDLNAPVGLFYRFTNAADVTLAEGFGCGSATVPVAAAAANLYVFVDGAVFGPQDCFPDLGAGTTGTITVTWTITYTTTQEDPDCLVPIPPPKCAS
ncbi:MAG: hypothetical protein ACT4PT_14260 [Methanobacteriota archaeon]